MKLRKKQLPSPRVRRMLPYVFCRLLILSRKTWLPLAYSAGTLSTQHVQSVSQSIKEVPDMTCMQMQTLSTHTRHHHQQKTVINCCAH